MFLASAERQSKDTYTPNTAALLHDLHNQALDRTAQTWSSQQGGDAVFPTAMAKGSGAWAKFRMNR